MIGYFNNQHAYGIKQLNYEDSASFACGLTIQSPSSNENISFPYDVTAYANGCGWDYVPDVPFGTVTLLDERGIIIARTFLVDDGKRTSRPYRATATLSAFVPINVHTGTMVFENRDPGNPKHIEVPVTFVH